MAKGNQLVLVTRHNGLKGSVEIVTWLCPYCGVPHHVPAVTVKDPFEDVEDLVNGVWSWNGDVYEPTFHMCLVGACGGEEHIMIEDGIARMIRIYPQANEERRLEPIAKDTPVPISIKAPKITERRKIELLRKLIG